MLSPNDFKQVIAHAPLVSFDFVVRNSHGAILLGRRRNRPAQNTWFLPGGRIYKGESLDAAISRISQAELGVSLSLKDVSLLGVYGQRYDENVFGEPDLSTHYLSIALEVCRPMDLNPPQVQHDLYCYVYKSNLHRFADLHPYVLDYFRSALEVSGGCHDILNVR